MPVADNSNVVPMFEETMPIALQEPIHNVADASTASNNSNAVSTIDAEMSTDQQVVPQSRDGEDEFKFTLDASTVQRAQLPTRQLQLNIQPDVAKAVRAFWEYAHDVENNAVEKHDVMSNPRASDNNSRDAFFMRIIGAAGKLTRSVIAGRMLDVEFLASWRTSGRDPPSVCNAARSRLVPCITGNSEYSPG